MKTINVSDETWEKIKDQVEEETKNVKEKKKICITIKNRFTGAIIWESERTTYKEAVEEAVRKDADLTDANLTDADLTDANLIRANLTRANLTDANLTGADLTDANLTGANLIHANLTRANLTGANLTGCQYYMGNGNRNFEALCRAIKTIKHVDGKFSDLIKS
jgi:uncharacterized protein YjbI with pentapeptide repeats